MIAGKDNHMSNLEPRLRTLNLSSGEGGVGDPGGDGVGKSADGDQSQQHQPNGAQPLHNGNGGMLVDDDKGFKSVSIQRLYFLANWTLKFEYCYFVCVRKISGFHIISPQRVCV